MLFQLISEQSSKLEIIRAFSHLTLRKILETSTPTSIGELRKIHGIEKTEAAIGVLVSDLNSSFEGTLTEDNILELIAECTSGFLLNLPLEAIYVAFRELKTSDIKYKLTFNQVLRKINKTWNEYSDVAQEINLNKHLQTKYYDPRMEENEVNKQAYKMAKNWNLNRQEYEQGNKKH